MKVSYKAAAEQFPPRRLAELAVQAERCGFDGAWISDHLQPWRHVDGHAPYSLSWLGYVAARTERILLGTSVLTPTFRYHPALIAQAFATLNQLAPERWVLGVGSGEALNEMALGLESWPAFTERSARLSEAVQLIRRLWSEERVTHEGQYYTTHEATVYDRPAAPIPVYVAAGGPTMARAVGEIADGFICTSGKGEELYRERLLPAVAEGLTHSHQPGRPFERMLEIKLSYARTLEQARENTRFWAALSLPAEAKHSVSDPAEMQRLADELPLEQVSQRWICATTPEQVVEAVRPYVEWGFDHVVFHAPGEDQEWFVEASGGELIPAVREAF